VREKELDAFVNLCFNLKEKPDFNNIDKDFVAQILRSTKLKPAPTSRLVQRTGSLKRYVNFFHGYLESTVVLTRDLFFHVYTFHDS